MHGLWNPGKQGEYLKCDEAYPVPLLTIDETECVEKMNQIVLEYYDYYLKGKLLTRQKELLMDITILRITKNQPEQLEIRCHEVTDQIREIVTFVKSRQGQLTGIIADKQYEIPVVDIHYIESVDNKVFLYSSKQVYETKQKLYELEEILKEKYFIRVAKSLLRKGKS